MICRFQYLLSVGFTFAFLLSSSVLVGQRNSFKMLNSKKIEVDKFANIKGSPYLFEDWMLAKAISHKGEIFDSLLINFNGHTDNIEVRKGNIYIDLDQRTYPLVQTINKGSRKPVFFQNINSLPLNHSYSRIVFVGLEVSYVEHFESRLETKTNFNTGVKKSQFSLFVPRKNTST